MKTHSITLNLPDGPTAQLTVFEPAEFAQSNPVILCLPALGVKASFYQPLAEAFTQAGTAVLTCDFRGIGGSSIRPSRKVDFGYHEIISYDIPAIISQARKLYPQNPLFFVGHSLGGQLGALALSMERSEICGLVMVATASPYYKGWSGIGRIGMHFVSRIFKFWSNLVGFFPGYLFRFAGKEAKTIMVDWCNYSMTNKIKIANNSFDFDAALCDLKIPVLAFTIDSDWMVPAEATNYFLRKMPSAESKHIHVRSHEISKHKLSHFSWVKEPGYFVDTILKWIRNQDIQSKSYSQNGLTEPVPTSKQKFEL